MPAVRPGPLVCGLAVLGSAAALVVTGPAGGRAERSLVPPAALPYVSSQAAIGAALTDPAGVPGALRERAREISAARRFGLPDGGTAEAPAEPAARVNRVPDLFNADNAGLPQNEEAVNACRADPRILLGGTNDFRGVVADDAGVTGWHFSNDGGRTLTNEGRLPPVRIGAVQQPSEGDPVVAVDETTCTPYMVDLNFGGGDPETDLGNGVGVYRSDPATLATCPGGGAAPSCWPTRRAAAGDPTGNHFLDKPWADAGRSGQAVVWITYTDFDQNGTGAIRAVRCRADLGACSAPILIDAAAPQGGADFATDQFSYVTIGADGRVYVTWTEISAFSDGREVFRHQMRVAQPGSTAFGPTRLIFTEDRPIPIGGFLHAADFRVATQPKNDVVLVGGRPRVFVVWDACTELALAFTCIDPQIKLTWSDDAGATWTTPRVISVSGDNYFPSISRDDAGRVVVAWYTNRYDPSWHHRQDVELRSVVAATGAPRSVQRVTPVSNEPDADPLLGGLFIGDYIQVFADHGRAWTHYNANRRRVPLLGQTSPINQQDNYLRRSGY